jgi:hypothetical protein
MRAVSATGFEDLPRALQCHVLSLLPFVERVRYALVARSWRALFAEVALQPQELRFDEAAEGSVGDAELLQCCERAGASLTSLDVSGRACCRLTRDGFASALAASGGVGLKTLSTWARSQYSCAPTGSAADAAALLAACPSLLVAAVDVRGTPADVTAALSALPGPGPKRVRIYQSDLLNYPQLEELAAWLPVAISAADVTDLELPLTSCVSVGDQAVASLVLALSGLQRLGLQQAPTQRESLLGNLCRALTAESPLTELALRGTFDVDAGLPDLTALIAFNRSRLQTLSIDSDSLPSDGCDCSPSAALYARQPRLPLPKANAPAQLHSPILATTSPSPFPSLGV